MFYLQAVQQIIDNLMISHIEIRSEESIDIQKYVHDRKVEKIVVPMSQELKDARKTFLEVRTNIDLYKNTHHTLLTSNSILHLYI